MKEMSCLDCSEMFEANSPDEMMKAMMPHYKEAHAEMMAGQSKESHEDWMKRFHKEWQAAPEKE